MYFLANKPDVVFKQECVQDQETSEHSAIEDSGDSSSNYLNKHSRMFANIEPLTHNWTDEWLSSATSLTEHFETAFIEESLTSIDHELQLILSQQLNTNAAGKFSQGKVLDNLNNHMQHHTGEKPFTCDECGIQYQNPSSLRAHLRVHTGQGRKKTPSKKLHRCLLCEKQFAVGEKLKKHRHSHTGEKPYTCEVCLKRFAWNTQLRVHMRTHSGGKPFACNVCFKRFFTGVNLRRHQVALHAGDCCLCTL
jgi:hypothetical protein